MNYGITMAQPTVDEALQALIGENIARIRGRRPQREIATKSGVNLSTINRIENGHFNPSLSTLAAIAGALEVPVDRLFFSAEDWEKRNAVFHGGARVATRPASAFYPPSTLPAAAGETESGSPEEQEARAEGLLRLARIDRTIAALLAIVRDVPALPPEAADRLRLLIEQHLRETGERAS